MTRSPASPNNIDREGLEIARAHFPESDMRAARPRRKNREKGKKKGRPGIISAKPEKKLELGKITKAGKGAASKAPPRERTAPHFAASAKKPKPPPPEQVVNSAWASVVTRDRRGQGAAEISKWVNWDEIKKMLKMLGRMDVDVGR